MLQHCQVRHTQKLFFYCCFCVYLFDVSNAFILICWHCSAAFHLSHEIDLVSFKVKVSDIALVLVSGMWLKFTYESLFNSRKFQSILFRLSINVIFCNFPLHLIFFCLQFFLNFLKVSSLFFYSFLSDVFLSNRLQTQTLFESVEQSRTFLSVLNYLWNGS